MTIDNREDALRRMAERRRMKLVRGSRPTGDPDRDPADGLPGSLGGTVGRYSLFDIEDGGIACRLYDADLDDIEFFLSSSKETT
jgi:hypothetical protein